MTTTVYSVGDPPMSGERIFDCTSNEVIVGPASIQRELSDIAAELVGVALDQDWLPCELSRLVLALSERELRRRREAGVK